MKIGLIALFVTLFSASPAAYVSFGQSPAPPMRRVVGNTIVSDRLPAVKINVSKEFKYLGKFGFLIGEMAKGERFVFVDAAENKRIRRLFIAQFEQILPASTEFYRYSFDKAMLFGGHRFRHNNFAFSGAEANRENPKGEAALTSEFLKVKGYKLEDELMSSRYLTVPDPEKKNEMILFYMENVSNTRKKLADFYIGDEETAIWKEIAVGLKERSLAAFSIN